MEQEPLVFEGAPISVPVTVGDKNYTLREATGEAAVEYRNACMASVPKIDSEGRPQQVRGLASVEPLLVSRCLFDTSGRPVKIQIITGWPQRIQKTLYNKIMDISDLREGDKDEEEEKEESAKNSSEGTEDGSD